MRIYNSALLLAFMCVVVHTHASAAGYDQSSRRLLSVATTQSKSASELATADRRSKSATIANAPGSAAGNTSSASTGAGFIEMRIYTAFTDKAKQYKDLTYAAGDLRCRLLPGFLGMFSVESGAADLNSFYSFYFYNSFDERDAARGAAPADPAWASYVSAVLPLLKDTQSSILQVPGGTPAAAVQSALDVAHARAQGVQTAPAAAQGTPAYMVRTYKVSPKTASTLLDTHPAMPTGSSQSGELVFYGTAAMGKTSGTMVELWRFNSAAAALAAQTDIMQVAGQGTSSSMSTWKKALAAAVPAQFNDALNAADEQVVILRPAKWSNWQ